MSLLTNIINSTEHIVVQPFAFANPSLLFTGRLVPTAWDGQTAPPPRLTRLLQMETVSSAKNPITHFVPSVLVGGVPWACQLPVSPPRVLVKDLSPCGDSLLLISEIWNASLTCILHQSRAVQVHAPSLASGSEMKPSFLLDGVVPRPTGPFLIGHLARKCCRAR